MTTVKELKRDETKRKAFLLDALQAANTLDKAEKDMEDFRKAFKRASQSIIDVTGLELWHTDVDGGLYFWRDEAITPKDSKYYPSRSAAIRALIDDEIDWK